MYFVADLDLARRRDLAPAFDVVDLVLLEQELDPVGIRLDHIGLVGMHLLQISPHGFGDNAQRVKIVLRFMQQLCCMKQRF